MEFANYSRSADMLVLDGNDTSILVGP